MGITKSCNHKIALIHDWLSSASFGGAEKTLFLLEKLISRNYSKPKIFTLIKDIKCNKFDGFKNLEIETSFIQNLPFGKSHIQYYLPLIPLAIEQHNLEDFNLIFSSSHLAAKGVLTSPDQIHISYVHTPMRYAWDQMHIYLKNSIYQNLGLDFPLRFLLHYLRSWDVISSQRIDHLIANSSFTSKRIKKYWGRESRVIFPPVRTKDFNPKRNRGDFYLSVCRLVPNKRVDLIIKAFNKLNLPLIIIGEGSEKKKLMKIKSKNIKIIGYQSDYVIKKMMEECRAFVYAGTEDFGIAPVEAMAAGSPVIGLAKGGLLDTVNCINECAENCTGLLFKSNEINTIKDCIEYFEEKEIWKRFNPDELNNWASGFSEEKFSENIKNFIDEKTS